MFKRATPKLEHAPFSQLPVRHLRCGPHGVGLAVRIVGEISDDVAPVVILPGYIRNMTDFAALSEALKRIPGTDFCFILLDLPGRGRSGNHPKDRSYSSVEDAMAVLDLLGALDISRAVVMGEGHGGQVAMLMAKERPSAMAGAVLIDAGPIADSRGLVRIRNNYRYLQSLRGETTLRGALRRIVAADYPGESEARLDVLAQRTFAITGRGQIQPLFDPRLVAQLEQFDFDDALEPQWQLFDCLNHAPLMIVRTQLSDQLRRATFTEMARRRPNAATLTIAGEGSPALLDGAEEREALAAFLHAASQQLENTEAET